MKKQVKRRNEKEDLKQDKQKQKVRLWHTEVDSQRKSKREEYIKGMLADVKYQ